MSDLSSPSAWSSCLSVLPARERLEWLRTITADMAAQAAASSSGPAAPFSRAYASAVHGSGGGRVALLERSAAGGHLSARLSVLAGPATYAPIDAVDDQSLRPDFAVLGYPAYLDEGLVPLVDARTSPTFIAHAEDDKRFIKGSDAYFAALKGTKAPHTFFRCATGGHGHSVSSTPETSRSEEKKRSRIVD